MWNLNHQQRYFLLYFGLLVLLFQHSCDGFRYDGFSLIEIDPQRQEDIRIIKEYAKRFNNDEVSFQFVRPPTRPNLNVSLICSPFARTGLTKLLEDSGILYSIKIADYQRLIDREFAENRRAIFQSFFRTGGSSDHTAYLRYSQINDWLKNKVKNVPHAEFIKFGETYEKRKLFMVKIVKNDSLPIVWMDGGIHAREWIAVSSPLYIIDKLLEDTDTTNELLSKFQFWIVPLVNPDGYEFSHQTLRLWRKNRARRSRSRCVGVDMNRNYPYEWGGEGSSDIPCNDQYRGPKAASENEINAIIEQMRGIRYQLKLVVSLHAYGQYILQPYSYSQNGYPSNYMDMTEVAIKTAQTLQRKHSTYYLVGRPPDILYPASGSSDDFTVGTLKIPFSFTIELPDSGIYGFTMPPRFIKPVGAQLWDGVLSLTSEVDKKLAQQVDVF